MDTRGPAPVTRRWPRAGVSPGAAPELQPSWPLPGRVWPQGWQGCPSPWPALGAPRPPGAQGPAGRELSLPLWGLLGLLPFDSSA